MTWQEAVEIVVGRTRHERYRWLTSDDNPDAWQRDRYRDIVVAMASGQPPTPGPSAPPIVAPRPCGGCPGSPYGD